MRAAAQRIQHPATRAYGEYVRLTESNNSSYLPLGNNVGDPFALEGAQAVQGPSDYLHGIDLVDDLREASAALNTLPQDSLLTSSIDIGGIRSRQLNLLGQIVYEDRTALERTWAKSNPLSPKIDISAWREEHRRTYRERREYWCPARDVGTRAMPGRTRCSVQDQSAAERREMVADGRELRSQAAERIVERQGTNNQWLDEAIASRVDLDPGRLPLTSYPS